MDMDILSAVHDYQTYLEHGLNIKFGTDDSMHVKYIGGW